MDAEHHEQWGTFVQACAQLGRIVGPLLATKVFSLAIGDNEVAGLQRSRLAANVTFLVQVRLQLPTSREHRPAKVTSLVAV